MPHSEIHGSKGARPSPRLFAACHVLHRLSVPRHPPNALTRLIRCASAAHREQTPRMQPQRLDLYSALHCYPPGRSLRSLHLEPKAPKELKAQGRQSLANGQSHSYPQCQSAEDRDRKTEDRCPCPMISPKFCLSLGTWTGSQGPALVEPTGIEPVTPCLQSRCSPS